MSTETTSSMLDSLSHVVKSLRHKAREALAEEDSISWRVHTAESKLKNKNAGARLAKKLPKDLKENLHKVVELPRVQAWTAPWCEIPKN